MNKNTLKLKNFNLILFFIFLIGIFCFIFLYEKEFIFLFTTIVIICLFLIYKNNNFLLINILFLTIYILLSVGLLLRPAPSDELGQQLANYVWLPYGLIFLFLNCISFLIQKFKSHNHDISNINNDNTKRPDNQSISTSPFSEEHFELQTNEIQDPKANNTKSYTEPQNSKNLKNEFLISSNNNSYEKKTKISIYIAYHKNDLKKAELIYNDLAKWGYAPWMKSKNLIPGQLTEFYIPKAIEKSVFFIICYSSSSVDARGDFQSEIKEALEMWKKRKESDIYLIPIRFDDCLLPDDFPKVQHLDQFDNDEWKDLLKKSIEEGLIRLANIKDK